MTLQYDEGTIINEEAANTTKDSYVIYGCWNHLIKFPYKVNVFEHFWIPGHQGIASKQWTVSNFRPMKHWFEENKITKYRLVQPKDDRYNRGEHSRVEFHNEDDAIAFKLAWG